MERFVKFKDVYLDSNVGGSCMFSTTDSIGLYLLSRGFALARMDVLAFNVQIMPAFATDTVCCSYHVIFTY